MMRFRRIVSLVTVAAIMCLLVAVVPAQTVLAAPTVRLSPASGAVGTMVTLTGTNFESYKGDSLSIFFNGVEIITSPVTVPDNGRLETSFEVPGNTVPGQAILNVIGPLGSTLATTTFMVEAAEIWTNVGNGIVGTEVTIMARGFYVNKMVAFYYQHSDVTTLLGTAAASATGECSLDFIVPPGFAGAHQIKAENEIGNLATTIFEVIPSVTVFPAQGAVDDIISVKGRGFASGEEVTVYLKSTPVAFINTDASGNFEGVFKVPAMSNDSYVMRVEDRSRNRVLMQFDIVAGARLDSTSGPVGIEVIATGNGFAGGNTLSVLYDDVELGTAIVEETGTFTFTFEIPASTGGQHDITFNDGANTAVMVFTVETAPPPVPALRLPETGTEVKSPVSFTWTEVEDPSAPVSYVVQVANDIEFADVVLEKASITAAEYIPGGNERLRSSKEGTTYYWRVKSVDAASNESGWSAAGSFRVVPSFVMPSWAIYVLIGLGAVAIGLLVFQLWRRRRNRYWD